MCVRLVNAPAAPVMVRTFTGRVKPESGNAAHGGTWLLRTDAALYRIGSGDCGAFTGNTSIRRCHWMVCPARNV